MNTLHDGVESVNTEYRIRLPKLPSLRKPVQKVQVYFNAGKGAKNCFHVGIRENGAIVESLYSTSSLTDAGNFAYGVSQARKLRMNAGEFSDTLISNWRRQGADCYREGLAITSCENSWQCQGWITAYENDVQPLVMYGWPTAEAVTA